MTLYHYTSGQGLFGIMNSDELHCSNVNFLNDPSEQSYFLELLNSINSESMDSKAICETLYSNSFVKSVLDPFDWYIASFSKNRDSLSMWNYYAKGNGYNIGVDIENIVKANKAPNVSIQKVELVYDRKRQIDDAIAYILKFKDKSKQYQELEEQIKITEKEEDYHHLVSEQDCIIEEFNDGLHKLTIGYKHQAYEREEEVRLIISENETKQNSTKFKISGNGVFVEYFALRLNLCENLNSVTIHPLSTHVYLEGTKRMIKSKIAGKEIEISVSNIPFRVV